MNFLLSKSSILIILLQIILGFNVNISGRSAIEKSSYETQNLEKETFNANFTVFQGQQSGSAVKQLIITINHSNEQNEHKVGKQLDDNLNFTENDIIVTEKYNVYLHYNSESGFIDNIVINTIK